jgi:hypothetical protein
MDIVLLYLYLVHSLFYLLHQVYTARLCALPTLPLWYIVLV